MIANDDFLVDVTRFPVVLITLSHMPALTSFAPHFAAIKALAQARGPLYVVNDARSTVAGEFSSHHRKLAASEYDLFRTQCPGCVLAEAYVLSSAVARGVLTAVRWLAPPPWPTRTFSSLPDALTWAVDCQRCAPRLVP